MRGGGADVHIAGLLIGRGGDHADAGGEVAQDAVDLIVGDDLLGDQRRLVGVGLVVVFLDLHRVLDAADVDAALLIPLLGHEVGGIGKADAVLGVVAGHRAGHGDGDGAAGGGLRLLFGRLPGRLLRLLRGRALLGFAAAGRKAHQHDYGENTCKYLPDRDFHIFPDSSVLSRPSSFQKSGSFRSLEPPCIVPDRVQKNRGCRQLPD